MVRVEFRQVLARRSDVLHDRHGALADERERALESRDCEMIRGPANQFWNPKSRQPASSRRATSGSFCHVRTVTQPRKGRRPDTSPLV